MSRINVSATIAAELIRISNMLYGHNIAFGPTLQQWDRYRNPDLPAALSVMTKELGTACKKGRASDWKILLSAVDLRYPPRPEAQAADQSLHCDELPFIHHRHRDDLPEGLPVVPITRTLRSWCPRTHAYVPIGKMTAYMVR